LLTSAFVDAVYLFVLMIFSLTVRECFRGWVASRLGDNTARMYGRVSLNPSVHMDPMGSLFFPALMLFGPFLGLGMLGGMPIGWARPIPVNTRNFRKISRDTSIVSLAAPIANLILIVLASLTLVIMSRSFGLLAQGLNLPDYVRIVSHILQLSLIVNLRLFLFHLVPLPMLDGGQVLRNYLPYNSLETYDRLGNGLVGYALLFLIALPFVNLLFGPCYMLIQYGIMALG